ncbi:MAG: recombinase family protein [Caulobacterales bacterium]|nr:recombinase family protein [Caulobacterales bacterium]
MTRPPRCAPVAIYGRYSSDRLSNIPIEDQIRESRAWALKGGWEPVQVFHDGAGPGAIQRNPPHNDVDPESGE